jgi:hypothetical protein
MNFQFRENLAPDAGKVRGHENSKIITSSWDSAYVQENKRFREWANCDKHRSRYSSSNRQLSMTSHLSSDSVRESGRESGTISATHEENQIIKENPSYSPSPIIPPPFTCYSPQLKVSQDTKSLADLIHRANFILVVVGAFHPWTNSNGSGKHGDSHNAGSYSNFKNCESSDRTESSDRSESGPTESQSLLEFLSSAEMRVKSLVFADIASGMRGRRVPDYEKGVAITGVRPLGAADNANETGVTVDNDDINTCPVTIKVVDFADQMLLSSAFQDIVRPDLILQFGGALTSARITKFIQKCRDRDDNTNTLDRDRDRCDDRSSSSNERSASPSSPSASSSNSVRAGVSTALESNGNNDNGNNEKNVVHVRISSFAERNDPQHTVDWHYFTNSMKTFGLTMEARFRTISDSPTTQSQHSHDSPSGSQSNSALQSPFLAASTDTSTDTVGSMLKRIISINRILLIHRLSKVVSNSITKSLQKKTRRHVQKDNSNINSEQLLADNSNNRSSLADSRSSIHVLSEPCVARLVSAYTPRDHRVFVSSSMPIRDLDAFCFGGERSSLTADCDDCDSKDCHSNHDCDSNHSTNHNGATDSDSSPENNIRRFTTHNCDGPNDGPLIVGSSRGASGIEGILNTGFGFSHGSGWPRSGH